jgi:hypothetical protein
VPPKTEDVAAVVTEFEKVLRSPVSDSDDFFSLGGTSLLAVRVVAGLTARCRKLFTLVDILRLRTPEAIAGYLQSAPDALGWTLPTEAAGEQYELSPTQRWYSAVYAGRLQPRGVMSFTVELPDGTAPAAVWRALDALLSRHDSLRTSVRPVGGRLVQQVLEVGATVPRERPWAVVEEVPGGRADVSRAAEEARAECAGRGIPLDGSPLYRAVLVSGTEPPGRRPARLAVVIHHLIFDGASVPVFTRELLALLADPTCRLRPAASSRAYTSWRLERESPDRVDAERRWWRDRLAGLESRCHLPLRGEPGDYVGYASTMTLPEPVREALAAAAKRHAVPVSTIRLAAYFVLGHALYGTRDMVVGLPISVRDHPALRDAVGMFANHTVLRHRTRERESVRELIQRAVAELTDAVEHRDYSFDRAMEQLPERCEPGRFPVTGAIINGAEMEADSAAPSAEPRTEGLRRCGVSDIQLYFADAPDRVDVELQHRSDILGPADGRRVLDCYVELLTLLARADDDHAVDSLVSAAADVLEPVRAAAPEWAHGAG